MNNKILLIVGAGQDDKCGIADYSYELVKSSPNDWDYLVWKRWKWRDIFKLIRLINKYKASYINLQYPTKSSYGSIIPHLLCVYYSAFTRKTFSITIHENQRMRLTYKLASNIFLLFANEVIFTTESERQYALNFFPFRERHYHIIKIFSNISKALKIRSTCERYYDFTYFGLIEEGRGIEKFIQLIRELSTEYHIHAAVIGMVAKEQEGYSKQLIELALDLNIDFLFNQKSEIVTELLNNSKYTYLPFVDGVSERRGSFLAAIINGAIPLTTKGLWTPNSFDSICYYIEGNGVNTAKALLNGSLQIITQGIIKDFVDTYVASSWMDVSKQYKEILNDK